MSLPFETDYAPASLSQAKKWLRVLDDLGRENVRILLVRTTAESNETFYRTGSDVAVPRGFAEDWLRHRDRRSRAVEQRWRWAIFIPACTSALAACTAGLVVLAPHVSSALRPLRVSHPMQVQPVSAAAAPAANLPSKGWQPVAVDEYVVVNGNIFQAEAGRKPEAIQRMESPDVIRFQMVPGNAWYEDHADAERTELDGYKQTFDAGVPYWTAYSLYVEPGPRLTADWIALGQIHGSRDPLLTHNIKNMIMTWILAGKGLHSEIIKQGQNYQFVEKLIIDPVNGYYGAWFNGKQVVDYHGRVGQAGDKYYYKFGIYRGLAPETMTVRYANFKIGTVDLSPLIANPDPPPPVLPWP